jgi:acyl-CoA synthetase (AMP-forming)/AMP-acid ligase II
MHIQRKMMAEDIAHYEIEGFWRNRTLIDLFDDAQARHPQRLAVIGPSGESLTFASLSDNVERVTTHLWAAGIRSGDVISVQLPNWLEFAIVHLAATRLGAVTNPLLPNYRSKELRYIFDFAGTKAAFIPSMYRGVDFPAMYSEFLPELKALPHVYVVGGSGGQAMTSFETLLTPPSCALPSLPRPSGNDVTLLIFTSGTESTPKGVMHSHNTALFSIMALAERFGLGPDEVIWTPSPLGHGSGFQWGLRLAIALGGTVVLQDVWDAEAGLDLIEREGCTFVYAATPFATMLLGAQSLAKRSSRLRIFGCGGAPIPPSIGKTMQRRMNCRLVGTWGMTECFVATASAPADADDKCWTTDGRALRGIEVAVFDETRTRRLDIGETGELATRGPHVSLGYFNDPARTRQTFTEDGWLFSGDLAIADAGGFVRLVGRKKDLINRGGIKYAAREIEDLLCSHPNVSEVAIVGVPDAKLGEKGCAFVVPIGTVTLEELTLLLKQQGVAKFKLPEYLVLLQELPLTASGKVQKPFLRDNFVSGAYRPIQPMQKARR